MALKHTQDQWYNTTDGEANFYGIATEGRWLMRVQQNGELSVEEQEANMKIIGAAPELLKALINMVQSASEGYVGIADINHAKQAIEKAIE